ncbi:MAG: CRTAC1 family protein [Candidatus Aminicenantes bacterium]|nr:CRTAC1 family protein [Candidatus Aminicenantes bacterium]
MCSPRGGFRVILIINALLPVSLAQSPQQVAGPQQLEGDSTATEIFRDATREAGIDFVHFNGMSGERYLCEMMGPGGAMFDYDNDGDLDLYLVQGRMLGPGKTLSDAVFPPTDSGPLIDRLYRNDLQKTTTGSRRLHFTDVTEESGIQSPGYGMGVAAGDFDNDGWTDLYVTNFGPNQMFRNNGDGTFTDVTAATGTNDPRWSVSAAFVDYDRDGWLDLYVGNYVDFSFSNHKRCFSFSDAGGGSALEYCDPSQYQPLPESLFRNRGDGTFEDVSHTAGIARESNGALGVSTADFDGDGWIDLYVANDKRPNHLWINQKGGSFRNQALLSGCAVSGEGFSESSMGVDAGDYDNDGDEDLFMTHMSLNEKNTLYVNRGEASFEDASYLSGLALPSIPFTGFGTAFFDFDNDGLLDILAVNGHVKRVEALARAKDPYPLHQTNQLFRNLGNGQFQEVTQAAGAVFELSEVSRGAAFGDVDNDGDTDVLVLNNNGPARLLTNQAGSSNHWMGLKLAGRLSRRDMLGARVAVLLSEGPDLWRRVHTDGSYASANDPRVLVGLGQATQVEAVRVYWPDGRAEEWKQVRINAYTQLLQGGGTGLSLPPGRR